MSTPRTDRVYDAWGYGPDVLELARQLEREIATVTAELETARKDAERYRWLQSQVKQVYMHPNAEIDNRMRWEFPVLIALTCINSEVSLDAAIDAAIAGKP